VKIIYVLGGSTFSGAEKRIFNTAILMEEKYGANVTVIASKSLVDKAFVNKRFTDISLRRISLISVPFVGKSVWSKIMHIFMLYAICAFKITRSTNFVHITLFNKMRLPAFIVPKLVSKAKFIFEITCPDEANSAATGLLLKNNFFNHAFISVSKNVDRILKERLARSNRTHAKLYLRNFPYVGEVFVTDEELAHKNDTVVFAHRLINRKNPVIAAHAFSLLAKKHPHWNFHIYGNGELEHKIKEILSSQGLRNLSYMGYVENLPEVLKRSKIFVSLISPDNYPSQSTLEALACGNALVISNTGESSQRFISENNGAIVELTCEETTAALERLMLSPRLTEMQKRSREFFFESYSVNKYIADSYEIYQSAIAN
jgi:glycosyltransferase involved in cell wall biosynthesis